MDNSVIEMFMQEDTSDDQVGHLNSLISKQLEVSEKTTKLANTLTSKLKKVKGMLDKLITFNPAIPYKGLTSLLEDYDDFDNLYADYPEVKPLMQIVINLTQLIRKFS